MPTTSAGGWLCLIASVAVLLALDLFVHRGERALSRRSAIVWTLIWVAAGVAFNGYVWVSKGRHAAEQYLAAYLIEKSLSLDNLFVFLIIFQTLRVPKALQKTVLTWGILGALLFRLAFILAGVAALEHFEWLTYGFALALIWAAYKSLRNDPRREGESKLLGFLARRLPVTAELVGARFWVHRGGKLLATPLAIAIVTVELSDIMFAIDSVPAALSVSRDRFVVYASNAFAILGLRALYIVIADAIARLRYLHYGLSFVLAFAAAKLLLAPIMDIPPLLSVLVIVLAIGLAVIPSLAAAHGARASPR